MSAPARIPGSRVDPAAAPLVASRSRRLTQAAGGILGLVLLGLALW
mgnify:CR=1 FL=1